MFSDNQMHPRIAQMIIKQTSDMLRRPIEGVKVDMQKSDSHTIEAVITGPEATPYEGGEFKIRLSMPDGFPNVAPRGTFLTKIFHPNVGPSGEICVDALKREWNPQNWRLTHILSVIRCLLIVPFPESSLNDIAGKMFMDNYDQYFERAKITTTIHALSISAPFFQTPKRPLKENINDMEIFSAQTLVKAQSMIQESQGFPFPEPLLIKAGSITDMTSRGLMSKKKVSNKKKWIKRI